MTPDDIKKLTDAFRAHANEQIEAAAAERKRQAEAARALEELREAVVTDAAPLICAAVEAGYNAGLPCSAVVHAHGVAVNYYLHERHGGYHVQFVVQPRDHAAPDSGMWRFRPGERGGFLNSHLWKVEGTLADVLIKLSEFIGTAIAEGGFKRN